LAANGILVTIVGIAVGALVFTKTLAFSTATIEADLTFTGTTRDTNGVLELGTVSVALTNCRRWRCRFLHDLLGKGSACGDAISDEVVNANANCSVVR
jgi:hypothetical protein